MSPSAAMHARERTSESCSAELQPIPMLGDTAWAASPRRTARPTASLLQVTNVGVLRNGWQSDRVSWTALESSADHVLCYPFKDPKEHRPIHCSCLAGTLSSVGLVGGLKLVNGESHNSERMHTHSRTAAAGQPALPTLTCLQAADSWSCMEPRHECQMKGMQQAQVHRLHVLVWKVSSNTNSRRQDLGNNRVYHR